MFGDACQPGMVPGGPHGLDAVHGVVTFVLHEFELPLPASLRSRAFDCDGDGAEQHSSSELLITAAPAVDGLVLVRVLERLVLRLCMSILMRLKKNGVYQSMVGRSEQVLVWTAALSAARVRAPPPPPASGSSPPRGAPRVPDTPPPIVLLKRRINGLRRAAGVEGVDAVQRRADALQMGEFEDELERREAMRRRYGR